MRFPGGEVPSTVGWILERLKKIELQWERGFSGGQVRSESGGTNTVGPIQAHTHADNTQGGGALQPADLRLAPAAELTIASGAVTLSQSHHTIDTEGDAA